MMGRGTKQNKKQIYMYMNINVVLNVNYTSDGKFVWGQFLLSISTWQAASNYNLSTILCQVLTKHTNSDTLTASQSSR